MGSRPQGRPREAPATCPWLAETDVDGDPLGDPTARDWAVRDYGAQLKTVAKAAPSTINNHLAALDDSTPAAVWAPRRRGPAPAQCAEGPEQPGRAALGAHRRERRQHPRQGHRAAAVLRRPAHRRGRHSHSHDEDRVLPLKSGEQLSLRSMTCRDRRKPAECRGRRRGPPGRGGRNGGPPRPRVLPGARRCGRRAGRLRADA